MADETEKLIDAVREYVFLYDTSHCNYKDVVKKGEAWKEIAQKLGKSSDAIKLKWKNVRDSYIKYLKFSKGTTGSAKKFKHWPWSANLVFLQDTVSLRPTASNIAQSSETQVVHEDENSDVDLCATANTEMPPPPKKFRNNEANKDVDKILKYLEHKKQNRERQNLDRIDYLFLSYAETFKKFPCRTQAEIKMEMAQMFGRAELHNMGTETATQFSPSDSSCQSWPPTSDNNTSVEVTFTDLINTNRPVLEFRSSSTDSVKEWYENFNEGT